MSRTLRSLDHPGWTFPWNDLEKYLKDQCSSTLSLVGFGSLLNPDSARRTIPDTPAGGHPPVVAMGGRRVFDYVIPNELIARIYGNSSEYSPTQRAALNVLYTRSPDDLLNGRLIDVPLTDLPALREREKGYNLRPVPYVRWMGGFDDVGIAYLLCAEEEFLDGIRILDSRIEPFPPYLEVCKKGANLVSAEFLQFFLETTYLGDRVTGLIRTSRK